MPEQQAPIDWKTLSIDDIYGVDLSIPPWLTKYTAPISQDGDRCPWPWEPQLQQVVGTSYRCGYCRSEVISGQPHLDYSTNPPS